MIPTNILKKEIGLFVDNDIDSYRHTEEIEFLNFLDMYLNKGGFFVVEDDNRKPLKYLDTSDIGQIKTIFSDVRENKLSNKIKLKELNNRLNYKTIFISDKENIKEVLEKMQENKQIFFPVIKEEKLIGRVSKEIIKNKINKLYGYNIE